MVMLDARNIMTTRPNKTLDCKTLFPFKTIRATNNMVYELDLLDSIWEISHEFHHGLLHLDNSDPLPGQTDPLPLLITGDTEAGCNGVELRLLGPGV